MIYSKRIWTEKSTNKATYKYTTLSITKGLIYKVEFYFPCGSAGLLAVAVFDSAYCVWPSNIGEWITGDDLLISFDDLYLKEQPPFEFTIVTANHDTAYKHQVAVRIGLVSKEIYQARFLPNKSWDYFANMLKELEREKETRLIAQRAAILETPFSWLKE